MGAGFPWDTILVMHRAGRTLQPGRGQQSESDPSARCWHRQHDLPPMSPLTSVCIMLILREHSVFTQL